MKYILLSFVIITIFNSGCINKQSKKHIDIDYLELRLMAAEEFSENYKNHYPRLMKRYRVYIDFYKPLETLKTNSGNQNKYQTIQSLVDKVNIIYSIIDIENKIVIEELNNLKALVNDSTYFNARLNFIDYLILNDLNKSVYMDDFQFGSVDLKANLTKIKNDSVEIEINPIAGFKWYLPIVHLNGDTLTPRLKNKGSLIIREKIDGRTKIPIQGKYQIKKNTEIVELLIDTVIELKN